MRGWFCLCQVWMGCPQYSPVLQTQRDLLGDEKTGRLLPLRPTNYAILLPRSGLSDRHQVRHTVFTIGPETDLYCVQGIGTGHTKAPTLKVHSRYKQYTPSKCAQIFTAYESNECSPCIRVSLCVSSAAETGLRDIREAQNKVGHGVSTRLDL